MIPAENLVPCHFRKKFSAAAAVLLWFLLPGCFMFVFPEKSASEIAHVKPGMDTLYALSEEDSRSCMRIYLPEKPGSTPCQAIVIFPGGAYGVLAWEKEGKAYAEFLNRHGIAGIVVKYPLGSLMGHFKRHPAMIDAALRAVRLIRYYAPQLGIDPNDIGVMGSSAGGHLAGLTAVWENAPRPDSQDPVERVSARPDFVIFCYPVVSMSSSCTHQLSRKNLTGSRPSPELLDQLSLEKRITPGFPPVFLWQTLEDQVVDPVNSRLLEAELQRNQVPHQAFFYRKGPHGMGLLNEREKELYPETARWSEELLKFLKAQRSAAAKRRSSHE